MRFIAISFFVFTALTSMAQERVKKIEFYGAAKTNILHQGFDVDEDTMNVSKANYGHSLIDLGILVRPSVNTEISTEFRLRNELGGFWVGAETYGISILTLKGVVNDVIRYKIGDIDLEMTPYTLYNNNYQDVVNEATVFQMAREVIDYENYFSGNAWRQQGIQSSYGFYLNNETFKSIDVNLFSTRNRTADPSSASPERLFSGGQIGLNTSYGLFTFNSANLFDLKNTVNDMNLYYNLVNISRNKNIYYSFTNKDTFSDRLLIFLFHLAFFFKNYKSKIDPKYIQNFYDYTFRQIELDIREIGYGDQSVNKKMKTYINMLYSIIEKIHNWENYDKDDKLTNEK